MRPRPGSSPRLLVLGATSYQVPFVQRARAAGCHVITVDWDLGNPAHAVADESHEVSTTDIDGITKLANHIGIDAITTFSSDPAARTVAHVAAALGIPGPNPRAVDTLALKHRFRAAQHTLGLPAPSFAVFDHAGAESATPADVHARTAGPDTLEHTLASASSHRVVYKPVDNCSSRGVTIVEGDDPSAHLAARRGAIRHSRSGRGIVEGYVGGVHLHCDAWIREGRLVSFSPGRQYFCDIGGNPVPWLDVWPPLDDHGDPVPDADLEAVARQVETLAAHVGYTDGPLNLEARLDVGSEPVLIELAPRTGGAFTPESQQLMTGFDFFDAVLDLALGRPPKAASVPTRGVGVNAKFHAPRAGRSARLMPGDMVAPYVHFWFEFANSTPAGVRVFEVGQSLCSMILSLPDVATLRRLLARSDEWLLIDIS